MKLFRFDALFIIFFLSTLSACGGLPTDSSQPAEKESVETNAPTETETPAEEEGGASETTTDATYYYVGGSLTGLASEELVLKINNSENLALSANGDFQFEETFEDGSNYSITLDTEPLLQNCTIANGSGTINGDDVRSIDIVCSNRWTHPTSLENDHIDPEGGGGDELAPQVAIDNSGNVIIVWSRSDGNASQIYKSEYRDGAWTHPTNLTDNISPDGENAQRPQVAMNDQGEAIIVWKQSDGESLQTFKSEYRDGTWTHPTNLSDNISPDDNDVYLPQVAMNNNGETVIAWFQYRGDYLRIYMSEYRGGVWTHPSGSSDYIDPGSLNATHPQVAIDNDGATIIVWSQLAEGKSRIFKSEYREGAWTHPSDSSDYISPEGLSANNPAVAMNENGDAIIAWHQSDDAFTPRILKSEYREGVWVHPTDTSDALSTEGLTARYAQIAMNDDGGAVIVCQQHDGAAYRVGLYANSDGNWQPVSYYGREDGTSQGMQVAMNVDGDTVVVWTQSDDTNSQVFKGEFREGVLFVPEDLLDNISPDNHDAYYPQIAINDHGETVIVWQQSDGSTNHIYKAEFR